MSDLVERLKAQNSLQATLLDRHRLRNEELEAALWRILDRDILLYQIREVAERALGLNP